MTGIILLFIGILLVVVSSINIFKEDKDSFDKVINNVKESSDDYRLEMSILINQMKNSIVELQKDLENLKKNIKNDENTNINNIEIDTYNEKVEGVYDLITKGYSDYEICKKLNIGKGELLLIKNCYKELN
jgi:translation elongation factor EF-G